MTDGCSEASICIVGASLESIDGVCDFSVDGTIEGLNVGDSDPDLVGLKLGNVICCILGLPLGSIDGSTDGEEDGTSATTIGLFLVGV